MGAESVCHRAIACPKGKEPSPARPLQHSVLVVHKLTRALVFTLEGNMERKKQIQSTGTNIRVIKNLLVIVTFVAMAR